MRLTSVATLLVDNHDSFSFNLYQLVAMIDGEAPAIVRNDELGWPELAAMAFDRIVLSPGPGRPDRAADFGVSREVIARAEVPLLGVCLGHQGIGVAHGARLSPARKLVHGRASTIHHRGDPLFDGIPQRFRAARYHSLALDAALPDVLEAIAWTDDGEVMAIRHRSRPLWGVQFHPESIATEHGRRLMENFLAHTSARGRRHTAVPLPAQPENWPFRLGAPAASAAPLGPETWPFRLGAPAASAAPLGPETWPDQRLSCRVRRIDAWADPERVFVTLFGKSPSAFWLDSSLTTGGARFSYMGDASGPLAHRLTCRVGGGVTIDGRPHRGAFFDTLRALLARVRIDPPPEVPFDFHGGFVGYLGYEMKAECTVQAPSAPDPAPGAPSAADPAPGSAADHARKTPTHEGGPLVSPATASVKAQPPPDASFLFADRIIAFDHRDHQIYLLCLVPRDAKAAGAHWLETAASALAEIPPGPIPAPIPAGPIPAPIPAGPIPGPIPAPPPQTLEAAFSPSRDDPQYLRDIAHCQAEIRAGETYQVCLTRTLSARARATVDALALHRVLRKKSPAPFAAFLRTPEVAVACASPERFLRIDRHGWIESCPIKGTAPRGLTTANDRDLGEALIASPKERAENLMIVDLVRNDLGAVCAPGTVTVTALAALESYATVHQLVSTIRGRLASDADAIDAIRHAFPAGSMTGAPKRRTLAILERLEDRPRGIYSGAIGYLSASGPIDLNVVIRTAVVTADHVTIGTGGAITALSDPRAELSETALKAAAIVSALNMERAC